MGDVLATRAPLGAFSRTATVPSALDRLRTLRRLWLSIAVAFAFRALCYAVMTALALYSEVRPAPTLPDVVLSALPFNGDIARLNYLAWLVLYLPLSLALLWTEPSRWVRYMHTGSLVSLARGVCIFLTGMGPPDPQHTGRGIQGRDLLGVYLDLLSPLGIFTRGTAHAYLTKDLFFSGHTATTFLLLLYLWRRKEYRAPAVVAHVVVVSTVLFAHMHYSIDVAGAWAFTFAIYALREWRPAHGRARDVG